MSKIERKYLAHYIDSAFNASAPVYIRLGDDLDDYSVSLNPDISTSKNIFGESRVKHNGYEPSSDVDPYYADDTSPLWEKLASIANQRITGDGCKTTVVDVLYDSSLNVVWAYREDVVIGVNSLGGDTSGVQIPFSVNYAGNRAAGSFDKDTKVFTASAALGALNIEVVVGTDATHTKVSDVIGESDVTKLLYKVASSIIKPSYGDAVTGYTALSLDMDIACTVGQKIIVAEKSASNLIIAASEIKTVVTGS